MTEYTKIEVRLESGGRPLAYQIRVREKPCIGDIVVVPKPWYLGSGNIRGEVIALGTDYEGPCLTAYKVRDDEIVREG